MSALRLHQLRPRRLAPVDLNIAAGGLVFMSGPSGSGKSLLLRAVADLDPNDGDALVGDLARSSLSAPEWRRRVGLLPAESGWWGETVGAHFPKVSDNSGAEGCDRRIQSGWLRPDLPALDSSTSRQLSLESMLLLQQLGFDAEVLDWTPARLSTGERQRLALARLLANRPEVLLLDEATANLDPCNRDRVETLIDDYRRRHTAAVLWVSHDAEQRARLGHRSLIIRAGKLLPDDTR